MLCLQLIDIDKVLYTELTEKYLYIETVEPGYCELRIFSVIYIYYAIPVYKKTSALL